MLKVEGKKLWVLFLLYFSVNPHFYRYNNYRYDSEIHLQSLGENVTLTCPIRTGILPEAYNVTWTVDSEHSFPEWYEIDRTYYIGWQSSLTLYDAQLENVGNYTCNVMVVNLYDGEVWYRTGQFRITADFDTEVLETNTEEPETTTKGEGV